MQRIVVVFVIASVIGTVATAQTPPYPNGCTVGLPLWAQHGLDAIFNGSCDNHDNCWAQCNGARGPYHGLQHRSQCDQAFLGDLTAACALRAAQLSFPIVGLEGGESLAEFLAVCEGVALAFFGAVSTPIGTNLYWRSQCLRGCNPMACMQAGLFFPTPDGRPPTCGQPPYTGHYFCYRQPYTVNHCTFHQCPGFFTTTTNEFSATVPFLAPGPDAPGPDVAAAGPEKGSPAANGEDDRAGVAADPDTKPPGDFQGGECSSILDWLCCACQWCPSCFL